MGDSFKGMVHALIAGRERTAALPIDGAFGINYNPISRNVDKNWEASVHARL